MPLFLPPRDAREIAIREKADCVVFGSFTQVAEEWTVRVRLELMGNSPEFPQRFRSHDFRDQDPASAAFSAVNWIRQMLAESATDLQSRARRPEELTTNNWHALQEYAPRALSKSAGSPFLTRDCPPVNEKSGIGLARARIPGRAHKTIFPAKHAFQCTLKKPVGIAFLARDCPARDKQGASR
jgi:hypothetical protein